MNHFLLAKDVKFVVEKYLDTIAQDTVNTCQSITQRDAAHMKTSTTQSSAAVMFHSITAKHAARSAQSIMMNATVKCAQSTQHSVIVKCAKNITMFLAAHLLAAQHHAVILANLAAINIQLV